MLLFHAGARLLKFVKVVYKMRCVICPSVYPLSVFRELYNKLLAVKNCVMKLSGQPSYLRFRGLNVLQSNFSYA
jgi:hypothetical protein